MKDITARNLKLQRVLQQYEDMDKSQVGQKDLKVILALQEEKERLGEQDRNNQDTIRGMTSKEEVSKGATKEHKEIKKRLELHLEQQKANRRRIENGERELKNKQRQVEQMEKKNKQVME